MRPGTLGFVGERLREGREARGLTVTALAELVGVSKAAISQFENASGTPSPSTMDRISSVLDLPQIYFVRRLEDDPIPLISYRSLAAATKADRARALRRGVWLSRLAGFLREYVEWPEVNYPKFDLPSNPSHISNEMIDDMAVETRRFWGLGDGPISNVVWLLENHGTVIARDHLATDSIDAFSFTQDTTPYMVLCTGKQSASRSRLDAAHELGHLILHRRIDQSTFNRPAEHKLMENQAFRFAGSFLLPVSSFSQDFFGPTLDALRPLKLKWMVSIAAMIMRASELDLVSPSERDRLWASLSRRGWKRHEPYDDELPVERPRLLQQSLEMVLQARVVSPDEIVQELGLSATDICELAGVSPLLFTEPPANVRMLTDARPRKTHQLDGGDEAEVVRFPSVRRHHD